MTSPTPDLAPRLYAVNLMTGEIKGGPDAPNVQHYDRATGDLTIHPLDPKTCDICVETAALMEALR